MKGWETEKLLTNIWNMQKYNTKKNYRILFKNKRLSSNVILKQIPQIQLKGNCMLLKNILNFRSQNMSMSLTHNLLMMHLILFFINNSLIYRVVKNVAPNSFNAQSARKPMLKNLEPSSMFLLLMVNANLYLQRK